jgi:hypothetical protein
MAMFELLWYHGALGASKADAKVDGGRNYEF